MADARDCPRCRLVNPPDAQRCDCGYDFGAQQVLKSYLTDQDLIRAEDDRRARHEQYGAAGKWLYCFRRWFGQ
jgi:hypothetical protein